VVTGGHVDPRTAGPTDGTLMRDCLLSQGVDRSDLIVENTARSTYENAIESRKLLERWHIRAVILVTDASHMLRAVRCFRKQGIGVTPSPCHHLATEFVWSIAAFLPSAGAASVSVEVAHEWVGLVWYWLRGRI
jgi:uncharacterized SAM-binding protein YcdF (DUF218 family)